MQTARLEPATQRSALWLFSILPFRTNQHLLFKTTSKFVVSVSQIEASVKRVNV
jgi:hypothetical protein